MINWIIGGLIAAATIFIIIRSIRRSGKSQCGCNCSGCGMANKCKEYGGQPDNS